MRTLLILLLLIPMVVQAEPAKRDALYWSSAAVMVLDGYSTHRFITEGKAKEVGQVAVWMYGPYPTDAEILQFTLLKLATLEWSRYWKEDYRKAFQWTVTITHSYVVYNNFQFIW